MAGESSMHGRDDQLERCRTALAAPGCRGLLFVGPAGIGKTRLVRALAAPADDREVVWISGSRTAADVPLAAVAALLPADTGGDLPTVLLLRHALLERAAQRRLLLVVDDAQFLDDGSAALVHQLALAGACQLLVTVRAHELAPESITRLWRDQIVERIDLGPLDRHAVGDVCASLLGGEADGASVVAVHDRTGGNPLFVRELVLATSAAGEWSQDGGRWMWQPGLHAAPRLVDLLADRLRAVDAEQRNALEHLAMAEPMGLGELQAITDDATIDALERAGLIAAEMDRRRLVIRCAHPMYGEVLRRSVSPLRARAIRAALVEAIRSTGARRREDGMRMASLALEAGVEIEPAVFRGAARSALAGRDISAAVRFAEEAFRLDPSFESGHVLADARYEDGNFTRIHALWPAWAPLAVTDEQRAFVGMHETIAWFYRSAEPEHAWSVLDELIAGLPEGQWREEAASLRGTLLMMSGRVAEAYELASPMLLQPLPNRVLIQAALATTHSLRAQGRATEALQVTDLALAAFDALGELASMVSSSVFGIGRGMILASLGRLDEGVRVAEQARDAALQAGDPGGEGLSELVLGDIHHAAGRYGAALAAARNSERAFLRANHPSFRRWALGLQAIVCGTIGDAAAQDDAIARRDAIEQTAARLFGEVEYVPRAHQLMRRGEPAAAERLLADGMEVLAARGEVVAAALCGYELGHLGFHSHAARLAEVVAGSDSPLLREFARHATALAAGDLDTLSDVAAQFEAMGARGWAARAAGHLNAAAVAAGDTRLGTRWQLHAVTLLGDDATAAVAGRTEEAPPRVVLSRREQEVAELAAQGMASRSIGERLFLSPRTVENHLARVYDKLGVKSRAELAHALAPLSKAS